MELCDGYSRNARGGMQKVGYLSPVEIGTLSGRLIVYNIFLDPLAPT
jgi:hypothetical protein